MSPRLRTTRDDHHDKANLTHHLPSCMSLLFSFSLLHIKPLKLNPFYPFQCSSLARLNNLSLLPSHQFLTLSYPLPPIYIFVVCTNVNNIHLTRATSICDSHGMCSTMISFVSILSFTSSESLSLSFMLLLFSPPFPSLLFLSSFSLPLLCLVSYLINYTGVVVRCHHT